MNYKIVILLIASTNALSMELPEKDSGQVMPLHHAALFTALAQQAQALMNQNDQIAHPVDEETIVNDSNHDESTKCTWPACNASFAYKRGLIRHLQTHTKEQSYPCDWPGCNTSYTLRQTLTRHIRTHAGEKPFKCNQCDYSCIYSSDLTKHGRIHTDEKPFKCSQCNYSSTQSGHVTRHMNIHKSGDAESKLFKKI